MSASILARTGSAARAPSGSRSMSLANPSCAFICPAAARRVSHSKVIMKAASRAALSTGPSQGSGLRLPGSTVSATALPCSASTRR